MHFLTSFTNFYIVPHTTAKEKKNEAHFTLSKCCDTEATKVFQWSLKVGFNEFFVYTFRALRGDAFRLSLKWSTYSESGATLLRIIDFSLWAGAGLRPAINCSKVTRISILSNRKRLWFWQFLIPTKQKHLLFFYMEVFSMLISLAVLYCSLDVKNSAVRRALLGREIVPRVVL